MVKIINKAVEVAACVLVGSVIGLIIAEMAERHCANKLTIIGCCNKCSCIECPCYSNLGK